MNSSSTNKALWPIILTVFVDLIGVGIVIPIAAPLLLNSNSAVLDASVPMALRPIILGFLLGVFSIAQFFGAPILGALADKHGRKKMLLISIFGTMIGYLIFAWGVLTGNIYLLFFSRILDGFTGGNIAIAYSAIADISDEKNKARNFSLVGMSFGIGFVIGPFLGGKLADSHLVSWFNLATPYFFAALLSLINIFTMLMLFPETLKEPRIRPVSWMGGINNIVKAFSKPNLRVIFTAIFLITLGFNFYTQFFQVFLIQKFKYTPSNIANVFAYIGIWIAFSQGAFARPISKRFSPPQILNFSPLLLGLALPLLLIPETDTYIYYILPFVATFQGLTTPNITALVSMQARSDEQGEILGMSQSMQSLAMALPPILAGFIASINKNLPILASSTFILMGWLVYKLFFKRKAAVV